MVLQTNGGPRRSLDPRADQFDAEQQDHAFALAVAVMRERVSQLPKADQDDLYELLPDVLGGNAEARQSACTTVNEILWRAKATVVRANLDDSAAELSQWLDFFSSRLKAAREAAGLTQQQLARQADLPQSHISRLENREHSPSAKTRARLAKALGKPASFFDPSADDGKVPTPERKPRRKRSLSAAHSVPRPRRRK
jgi:DNA-binding XRE family transcriptional regulator